MSPKLTVVYDACVLYPAPLRDLLMRLAMTDVFRARWTDLIHDEWIRNLLAQRPDLSVEALERTRHLMNAHVRGCLVSGFDHLISSIQLTDPDDRHVVAAAIHCEANAIVTFNLSDFPDHQLQKYDLKALHPDTFVLQLIEAHAPAVMQAVAEHRASLKKPTKSVDEYLDTLLNLGLPRTVTALRTCSASL